MSLTYVLPKKKEQALMNVTCNDDGSLLIHARANEGATLAGRDGFLDLAAVQADLLDKIRTAWYAADCPPVTDGSR